MDSCPFMSLYVQFGCIALFPAESLHSILMKKDSEIKIDQLIVPLRGEFLHTPCPVGIILASELISSEYQSGQV